MDDIATTKAGALQLFQADESHDPEQLQQLVSVQVSRLRTKLNTAPSLLLRTKYREELDEMVEASRTLGVELPPNDAADYPSAQPDFSSESSADEGEEYSSSDTPAAPGGKSLPRRLLPVLGLLIAVGGVVWQRFGGNPNNIFPNAGPAQVHMLSLFEYESAPIAISGELVSLDRVSLRPPGLCQVEIREGGLWIHPTATGSMKIEIRAEPGGNVEEIFDVKIQPLNSEHVMARLQSDGILPADGVTAMDLGDAVRLDGEFGRFVSYSNAKRWLNVHPNPAKLVRWDAPLSSNGLGELTTVLKMGLGAADPQLPDKLLHHAYEGELYVLAAGLPEEAMPAFASVVQGLQQDEFAPIRNFDDDTPEEVAGPLLENLEERVRRDFAVPRQIGFVRDTRRKRLFVTGDVLNEREMEHATKLMTINGDGEWYRLQLNLQIDADAVRRSLQTHLIAFSGIRVVIRNETILIEGKARDAAEKNRIQKIAESHVFLKKHVILRIEVEQM